MPTIICLQNMTEDQQELVRQAAPDARIVFNRTEKATEEDYRQAEIVCGWNSKVKEWSLGEGGQLRWLQSWSSGIDSLPLDLLERKGVYVTDASGVHARSVSETAVGMMLALSRGIAAAVLNQRDALWESPPVTREMNGGTVAVIGAGQIGREVARLARAFDMKVIAVRRSGGNTAEADVTYTTFELDKALAEADYIVNILPYTSETHHLFDAGRFAAMKKNAYFINVGRGGTVKTEDLLEALRSDKLAGAGLDVFEQEPLPADHPLWQLPNVILTPHNAGGATDRNMDRLLKLFLANLEIYRKGNPAELVNLLDYGKQY